MKNDRVIVSPPPVEVWNDVSYSLNESQQNVIFYGRIFQLKGVDLFVDAAIALMIKRPENNSIFYLVGYDGLDLNGQPYKEQLLLRIPDHLKERFIFTGQLNHQELEQLLTNIRFAVFPNYVESFVIVFTNCIIRGFQSLRMIFQRLEIILNIKKMLCYIMVHLVTLLHKWNVCLTMMRCVIV